MNLINNKKKNVKQFLQEMKANKTNKSSNRNSINSQMKSTPIMRHYENDLNSNGISKRINIQQMDSRRQTYFNPGGRFNNQPSSNIGLNNYSQRIISPVNMSPINRFTQNPNQNEIYYPPERNVYNQNFSPINQSNPVYYPHQLNHALKSQNIQRLYSLSQSSQYFDSNHQLYEQSYNPLQKNRFYNNNKHQYGSQNSLNNFNLSKSPSFINQSRVTYNSDREKNYHIQPIKQQIQHNFNKYQINQPQQVSSYYSQRDKNKINSYQNQNKIQPHNKLSQVSHANNLQMQQITEVSIGQSSSENNTPGKLTQFTLMNPKRKRSQTPISKLSQQQINLNKKSNFQKKQKYFQIIQKVDKKEQNPQKITIKVKENLIKITKQQKIKIKEIMTNQKETQKILDKIIAQLNIFSKNLSRDEKQIKQWLKQGSQYNNFLIKKHKNQINTFKFEQQKQIQLEKFSFCEDKLIQLQEQIEI